ncbi:AraC family transcriptional regulator [Streptomyces capparidis]
MEALGSLLDGPRARDAFVMRAVMEPPWAVRVEDRAPLSVVAVVRGQAWVLPERGAGRLLRPGDVAVTRGPDPYVFADDPGTPPQVVIHPGQWSATPDGDELCEEMGLGVRTWGDRADGSAELVVGTYQHGSQVSRRLLGALPALLVLRREELGSALVDMLGQEAGRAEPGQEVVLDRLLDLLVVAVLRAWFARSKERTPGWYRAQGDPVVGPVLKLLHDDPARPWTVAELAERAGVSRAALARRFTGLVGEPPMAYLTGWRLALAADLLRESDATVGAVARRVGYGSPFALSTAFKRVYGVSPREYRGEAEPLAG